MLTRQEDYTHWFYDFSQKLRRNSPYYPKTKEFSIEGNVIKYKDKKPPYEEKTVINHILGITSLLRVEHEGVWYIQHFLETRIVSDIISEQSSKEIWDSLREEFRYSIYLHMKWGVIQPDLESPYGEPLYTVDVLQESELKRLGLE